MFLTVFPSLLRRSRLVLASIAIALCCGSSERIARADELQVATQSAEYWSQHGWPLIQKFCLSCHNADVAEAELDLSTMESLSAMGTDGGNMNRVLEMVRFGAMPPDDAELPSEAQRKQLVTAIDKTLYAVSCDLRVRPGKVTARRLNRAEYNHSIRDLFGIDLRPADAFPSDEVGGGFDNNGDMLSLSPMLVEKYLAAAEDVSQKVLLDPDDYPRIDEDRTGDRLVAVGDNLVGSFFGRFLAEGSFVWAEYELPAAGEYRLKLSAGATAEPKKDAKEQKLAAAVYDQSGKLLGICHYAYYGGSGDSEHDELKVQLPAGTQRIVVLPIKDEKNLTVGEVNFPDADRLEGKVVAWQRKALGQPLKPSGKIDEKKYPFMVRRISLSGPAQVPADWYPPQQKQILRKTPSRKNGKYVDVDQAALECLKPLIRRAFRGPVSKDEIAPYANLVAQAVKRDESFVQGLQIAISAVLVSPRFLFRIETPTSDSEIEPIVGDAVVDREVRLTQHQLATRLAYFLWSSTPDEKLLELADQNKLNEKELLRQIQRLLADKRSNSLSTEFAAQWFGLRNLDGIKPDTDLFKNVNEELLRWMPQETQRVFMHVVRENRPVIELLSADYTFINEPLAKHYGIDSVQGDEFRRVSLVGQPRRGVLSHASVLTLTSNPTRTSPVKRGKWILENILGTPPPDPPPGVPELEETKTAAADASLREQMELHRDNPACASCHRVMDDLGFGLEQFDAVGRFRKLDGKLPIDASGELPGGRSFVGAAELTQVLATSERESFVRTTVSRLLAFALGRELSPTDRCSVDEIADRVQANGGRFQDIVGEVVRSRQFQYYQWSGVEE